MRKRYFKQNKIFNLILTLCFVLNTFSSSALGAVGPLATNYNLQLPLLRYLSINSANPYNYFNFLLDKGTATEGSPERSRGIPDLTKEAKKLINYFFLGISLSADAFWVNLQPKDAQRMTSEELSRTDMGKVLLEQDLQLKKDVAKYLHPDNSYGKKFWERLYTEIGKDKVRREKITTSQRVWIVPDTATVVETADGAFISEAKLKVLLENEYLKAQQGLSPSELIQSNPKGSVPDKEENIQTLSESLMKEIIITQLESDVNHSPTYAPLRQIYYSLILAGYFKRKQGLSPSQGDSLRSQGTLPKDSDPYISLINQNKTQGLESELPWSKDKIFQEYINSYQKGEYQIKRSLLGLVRMYFSGGADFNGVVSGVTKLGLAEEVIKTVSDSSPMGKVRLPTNKESGLSTAMLLNGKSNDPTAGEVKIVGPQSSSPMEYYSKEEAKKWIEGNLSLYLKEIGFSDKDEDKIKSLVIYIIKNIPREIDISEFFLIIKASRSVNYPDTVRYEYIIDYKDRLASGYTGAAYRRPRTATKRINAAEIVKDMTIEALSDLVAKSLFPDRGIFNNDNLESRMRNWSGKEDIVKTLQGKKLYFPNLLNLTWREKFLARYLEHPPKELPIFQKYFSNPLPEELNPQAGSPTPQKAGSPIIEELHNKLKQGNITLADLEKIRERVAERLFTEQDNKDFSELLNILLELSTHEDAQINAKARKLYETTWIKYYRDIYNYRHRDHTTLFDIVTDPKMIKYHLANSKISGYVFSGSNKLWSFGESMLRGQLYGGNDVKTVEQLLDMSDRIFLVGTRIVVDFEIVSWIPLTSNPSTEKSLQSSSPPAKTSSPVQRILYVDNNFNRRSWTAEHLREAGFSVTTKIGSGDFDTALIHIGALSQEEVDAIRQANPMARIVVYRSSYETGYSVKGIKIDYSLSITDSNIIYRIGKILQDELSSRPPSFRYGYEWESTITSSQAEKRKQSSSPIPQAGSPIKASESKKKYVYYIGEEEDKYVVGGKGRSLSLMHNKGLPVPPAFTIPTWLCPKYLEENKLPESLIQTVEEKLARLEQEMDKKRFGDTEDPLLLSVRSGAAASMPGMMDTILNIGLNDENVDNFGKRTNPRTAWDSYRRLIQKFSDVVLGMEEKKFEDILKEVKAKNNYEFDNQLNIDDLKNLVSQYKGLVKEELSKRRNSKIEEFPQKPREQLYMAIEAVFKSWNNKRAVDYRRIFKLPATIIGTAVNIQNMVFGNRGEDSGTGVLFTRDPATGEKKPVGEFLSDAQGEDVVAGIRNTLPIDEMRGILPQAHAELIKAIPLLEELYGDMVDVEFTVEKGKLWFLQSRQGKRTGIAAFRIAYELFEDELKKLESQKQKLSPQEFKQEKEKLEKRTLSLIDPYQHIDHLLFPVFDTKEKEKAEKIEGRLLTKGINASPGAAVGGVVFSAKETVEWAAKGEKVILVREMTDPGDLDGMKAAQGVLTTTGGLVCHASVVARGMGKPTVVGAKEIILDEKNKLLKIKGREIKGGDVISIDGFDGKAYEGKIKTIPSELKQVINGEFKPEESTIWQQFQFVLSLAEKYKKLGVQTNADIKEDAERAILLGAGGIGLTRTEHIFTGARIEDAWKIIFAQDEAERKEWLDEMLPRHIEDFSGVFEAMGKDDGERPVTIRLLDPPLHEFLPKPEKADYKETLKRIREVLNKSPEEIESKIKELQETNPMFGHRGVRLSISYPEIAQMQTKAIIMAAIKKAREGIKVIPKIMIALIADAQEYKFIHNITKETADQTIKEEGAEGLITYKIGTMIELARAPLIADELVEAGAQFFSVGSNDLTQTVDALSRDDAEAKVIGPYIEKGIVRESPFSVLDFEGVGALLRLTRMLAPGIELGICGEHGGDPNTIMFLDRIGLDYVSAVPDKVPVARLSAALAQTNPPQEPLYDKGIAAADELLAAIKQVRNWQTKEPLQVISSKAKRKISPIEISQLFLSHKKLLDLMRKLTILGYAQEDKEKIGETLSLIKEEMEKEILELLKTEFDGFGGFSITLLDQPLNAFLNFSPEELEKFSQENNITEEEIEKNIKMGGVRETNPLLAERGVRLLINYPELYKTQIEAVFNAFKKLPYKIYLHKIPTLRIDIPFLMYLGELEIAQELIENTTKGLEHAPRYELGVVISMPRAAIIAKDIVTKESEISLVLDMDGLTSTVWGAEYNDSRRFMNDYIIRRSILKEDPFDVLDTAGVGAYMLNAITQARQINPDINIEVRGRQLENKQTQEFLAWLGLGESSSPLTMSQPVTSTQNLKEKRQSSATEGSPERSRRTGTVPFGGIDLNAIKMELKNYAGSPLEEKKEFIGKIKTLLCLDALLDKKWFSLAHLYFQEIIRFVKDDIIADLQEERDELLIAARELKDKGYLVDTQSLQFLSLLETGGSLGEIKFVLSP